MAQYQGYAERYEDLVEEILIEAKDREVWQDVESALRDDSAIENAIECAIDEAKDAAERMERVILDDVRRRIEEVFAETILDRLDADPTAYESVVEAKTVRDAVGRVYHEVEAILDAAVRDKVERNAEAYQDGGQVTFSISFGRSYEWTEYDRRTLDERLHQLRGIVESRVEEAEEGMLPRRFETAMEIIAAAFARGDDKGRLALVEWAEDIARSIERKEAQRRRDEEIARTMAAAQAEQAAAAEAGIVINVDAEQSERLFRLLDGGAAQAEDRQTEEILAMLDGDAAQALAAQAASEAAALAQFDEDAARVLAMRQGDVDAATTDEARAAALSRLAESRSTWAAWRLSRFGRKEV